VPPGDITAVVQLPGGAAHRVYRAARQYLIGASINIHQGHEKKY